MNRELSSDMSLTYEQKKQLEKDYQRPESRNPETRREIARKTVLGIVGPTGAGKTTAMHKLIELYPKDFGAVQNETTRQRGREEVGPNQEFVFRTEDEAIDDMKAGNLVQVALGANGDFYFTRPSGYPDNKTGLMAVMYHVVPEFRELGFKHFEPVYVVTDLSTLQHRIKLKAQDRNWSREDYFERIDEARASMSFANNDPTLHLIYNDTPEGMARRIKQVADGQKPDDEEKARDILAIGAVRL